MAVLKKQNVLKNGDIDSEALFKYWEVNMKMDPDWLKIMKDTYEQCAKAVTTQLEEIQKRSMMTTEECNMKFQSIFLCMKFKQVLVS
jgi:hypothetical protein